MSRLECPICLCTYKDLAALVCGHSSSSSGSSAYSPSYARIAASVRSPASSSPSLDSLDSFPPLTISRPSGAALARSAASVVSPSSSSSSPTASPPSSSSSTSSGIASFVAPQASLRSASPRPLNSSPSLPVRPSRTIVGLNVPASLRGIIIGTGGQNLALIERESGATLDIPRKGEEGSVYVGGTHDEVEDAIVLIEDLLERRVEREDGNMRVAIPAGSGDFVRAALGRREPLAGVSFSVHGDHTLIHYGHKMGRESACAEVNSVVREYKRALEAEIARERRERKATERDLERRTELEREREREQHRTSSLGVQHREYTEVRCSTIVWLILAFCLAATYWRFSKKLAGG